MTSGSASPTWSDPLNAAASDSAYAKVNFGPFSRSAFLTVTDFGFSLPSDAVVVGIEAEVQRLGTAPAKDDVVRLVRAGQRVGNDAALSDMYGLVPKWVGYGGITDLWGTTWTRADVNSSAFGLAFRAACLSFACSGAFASVDHIRIRVYYQAC